MTTALTPDAVEGLRAVIGPYDLEGGLCLSMDPDIWTGDWCTARRSSGLERHARTQRVARAQYWCSQCPVLQACTRQLEKFEADEEPVMGVMAGREFVRPGEDEYTSRGKCQACDREMVVRRAQMGPQDPPEGRVFFRAHGHCESCSSRLYPDKRRRNRKKEKI